MECKVENPLARKAGLPLSSPVVLSLPERFVQGCILLCPAGNPPGSLFSFGFFSLWVLYSPPVIPPVFEHPGVFWFYLFFFFSGKIPCFCQTLAAPRKGARHSIPWACGERWVRDVSGMLLVAWDILWGLLSPGGVSQRGFPCVLKPSQQFIPSQALPVG